jgi:hypothetical protein
VVFPGIASYYGRRTVGTGTVGSEDFPAQGIFKVDQLCLVKIQITHIPVFSMNITGVKQAKQEVLPKRCLTNIGINSHFFLTTLQAQNQTKKPNQ